MTDTDRIADFLAQDLPIAEIARRFGKSRRWVRDRMRGNVPPGKQLRSGPLEDAEIAEIHRLRDACNTPSDIGKRLHRSVLTIRRVLGEPMRPRTGHSNSGWPKIETTIAAALNGRRYEDVFVRRHRPVDGDRWAREVRYTA